MSDRTGWNIKGTSARTRDVARERARQEGLTLGEYLNRLLTEESGTLFGRQPNEVERPTAGRLPPGYGEYDGADDNPMEALQRLTRRIEAVEARSTLAISGIDQSVVGLLKRLEHADQSNSELGGHVDALMDDVRATHDELKLAIERIEADDGTQRALEGMRAIEGAVAKLADHVYSEGEAAQNDADAIKARVEAGFSELTDRVEGMEAAVNRRMKEAGEAFDSAVQAAEQRNQGAANHLADRFATLEKSVLQRLQSAEESIGDNSELTQRVEALETGMSDAIGNLEDTLRTLQSRLSNAETGTNDALSKLQTTMGTLDDRIQSVAAQAVKDDSRAMKVEFEARFEGLAKDLRSTIDRTRTELASQIDAAATAADPAMFTSLRSDIDGLRVKLGQTEARQSETLSVLSDRLDTVIGDIETRVAALDDDMKSGGPAVDFDQFAASVEQRLTYVEAGVSGMGEANVIAVQEEVSKLAETISTRLDGVEARESQTASLLGEHLTRITDTLDQRIVESERNSASAIEQLGQTVANITKRMEARHNEALAGMDRKLSDAQEQQDARFQNVLQQVNARLEEMQSVSRENVSPVQRAIASLAARLDAVESFNAPPFTNEAVEQEAFGAPPKTPPERGGGLPRPFVETPDGDTRSAAPTEDTDLETGSEDEHTAEAAAAPELTDQGDDGLHAGDDFHIPEEADAADETSAEPLEDSLFGEDVAAEARDVGELGPDQDELEAATVSDTDAKASAAPSPDSMFEDAPEAALDLIPNAEAEVDAGSELNSEDFAEALSDDAPGAALQDKGSSSVPEEALFSDDDALFEDGPSDETGLDIEPAPIGEPEELAEPDAASAAPNDDASESPAAEDDGPGPAMSPIPETDPSAFAPEAVFGGAPLNVSLRHSLDLIRKVREENASDGTPSTDRPAMTEVLPDGGAARLEEALDPAPDLADAEQTLDEDALFGASEQIGAANHREDDQPFDQREVVDSPAMLEDASAEDTDPFALAPHIGEERDQDTGTDVPLAAASNPFDPEETADADEALEPGLGAEADAPETSESTGQIRKSIIAAPPPILDPEAAKAEAESEGVEIGKWDSLFSPEANKDFDAEPLSPDVTIGRYAEDFAEGYTPENDSRGSRPDEGERYDPIAELENWSNASSGEANTGPEDQAAPDNDDGPFNGESAEARPLDVPRPSLADQAIPFGEADKGYLNKARAAAIAAAEAANPDKKKKKAAKGGGSKLPIYAVATAVGLATAGTAGYLYLRGKQGPAPSVLSETPGQNSAPAVSGPETGQAPAASEAANAMAALLDTPATAAEPSIGEPTSDDLEAVLFDAPAAPATEAGDAAGSDVPTLAALQPVAPSDASVAPSGSTAPYDPIPAGRPITAAVEAGDPVAELLHGQDLVADGVYEEGVALIRAAANDGLAAAQYRLAKLHEKGLGVPRDTQTARTWTERAANGNNVKAMHDLAVFYADGEGGEQSYAKAAEWFGKAAAHGVMDSQYNLAVLYERGLGVTENLSEAAFWFATAEQAGDSGAGARLATLREKMSSEAHAEAVARAERWQVSPMDERANGTFAEKSWGFGAPNQVRAVQAALSAIGYPAVTPTGRMDTATAEAIAGFEETNGLAVTATLTPELVNRLNANAARDS
ncbi:MAG: peptidoglycan-binding protein [Pseudomonadota bacterium]